VQYCEYSYAKVNLHLEVLAKRQSGYHDILSLMMRTGLFDLLKLDDLKVFDGIPGDVAITIIPDGGDKASLLHDIPPEKNLITKAAKAYFLKAGKSAEITVRIEKNIPAGGGLGGGSADAASMLVLLNKALGLLSSDDLHSAAVPVGADVPFCLYRTPAFCEGIGEIITPAESSLDACTLIVNNGTHVDTGWAYGRIDAYHSEKAVKSADELIREKEAIAEALRSGDAGKLKDVCRNDFEEPVFAAFPSVKELKTALYDMGADMSIMTGSGSTVIGLFKDRSKADKAYTRLIDKKVSAYVTEFVTG